MYVRYNWNKKEGAMEISVLTLPARFHILKKRYKAFEGCIFVQVKFHVNHDKLDYVYVLSALFVDEKRDLRIKTVNIPEEMSDEAATGFILHGVGLRNLFNLFKEEIFEMLELELDKDEYAHLRFVFLPI
jgi:hypothetical protein